MGKERRLNEIHKKIKHLNHTLIVWAEDNKYKKHRNGDTEVSYKKNQNIDPGGEYVDFEDLNDEK